jgi:DNA processing protein
MEEKNNYPIHTCVQTDTNFPQDLFAIKNPPKTLYYRGTITSPLLRIAIVGTRKASDFGLRLARRIAYECSLRGWCVVSGLAFGIDAQAHQGSLDANGQTWAVLAHGLHTVQPKQHTPLAQKIMTSGGCLLSEYTPETPALAHQFLERNRIIAGVSSAVIVIEAPRASGSLTTARCAAQQEKPVFVFPGPVSSVLYEGSHELIRSGARLVRSIEDIEKDLLQQSLVLSTNNNLIKLSELEEKILAFIAKKKNSVPFDEIFEYIHIPHHELIETLNRLITMHYIQEDGLQTYCLLLPKK